MELKLSAESIRIIKKFLKLDTSFSKQHFDAAKDKAKLARVVRWRNAFCERIVKKPHASRKDRRELQALRRAISHHTRSMTGYRIGVILKGTTSKRPTWEAYRGQR